MISYIPIWVDHYRIMVSKMGEHPKIAPTSTGLVYDGLGGHMRLYHTNVGYTIWLFNIAMGNPQN